MLSLLALIGVTLIIARGTITRPIRRLLKPLECCQCVGTWVGVAAGASGVVQTGQGRVVDAIIVGAAASFAAMLADAVLLKLLGDPNEP